MLKNHDFKFFGKYRIVLGILVILYFGVSKLIAAGLLYFAVMRGW